MNGSANKQWFSKRLAKLAGWVFLWCCVSPAASPSCLIVIITVKHLRVFMPYTSPVRNIKKRIIFQSVTV